MANYTIIGGDKKEYGPVTAEEVRQWQAEGRLDANSLMRSDSDTEWRPLATFPEFASAPAPRGTTPPPLTALPSRAREGSPSDALDVVRSPASSLLVTGVLNSLWSLYILLGDAFTPNHKFEEFTKLVTPMVDVKDPQVQAMLNGPMIKFFCGTAFSVGNDLFMLAISVLIALGAWHMKALRNYEFSLIAAILAILPCMTPMCLLGLPFGIWAIVVLRKPGMKGQFH